MSLEVVIKKTILSEKFASFETISSHERAYYRGYQSPRPSCGVLYNAYACATSSRFCQHANGKYIYGIIKLCAAKHIINQ